MNLISLDTNIVLRLILRDIPDQSKKAAEFVAGTSCYITDVVVAESVFVLEKVYKLDREYIIGLMTILFKLKTVSYNEVVVKMSLSFYKRFNTLSFVDCYSLAEATTSENELVTFDKKLIKLGGPTVKEPQK